LQRHKAKKEGERGKGRHTTAKESKQTLWDGYPIYSGRRAI